MALYVSPFWFRMNQGIWFLILILLYTFIFRCYEEDPDGNAEMQLEQALDENDLVYHDTMIAASSWREMSSM